MTQAEVIARIEKKFDTKFKELMDKIVFRDVYHADNKRIDERCEARKKEFDKLDIQLNSFQRWIYGLMATSLFLLLTTLAQFVMLFLGRK